MIVLVVPIRAVWMAVLTKLMLIRLAGTVGRGRGGRAIVATTHVTIQ